MRHKVIFRADGSATVGYGHVHRLLSLLQLVHQQVDAVFVSHDAPAFLEAELSRLQVPLQTVSFINYKLPDERTGQEEVAFDMDALLTGQEIVVLDGYWFGKQYQQCIKDKGCLLVYIDDLVQPGAIADIIINHSMGVGIGDYKKTAPGTAVYTGAAYSLVNVPAAYRHQPKNASLYHQLLISMGGADPLNFTEKIILDSQQLISRFEKVVVLTGTAYQHQESLSVTVADMRNVELITALPKTAMLQLMQHCTAAILSASTMSVEYANTGGALAVVQTAENQQYLYKGLLSAGVAVTVNQLGELTALQLAEMQQQQRQVFDGKASVRFEKLFSELQLQAELEFVQAAPGHLEATYQWASDPQVRAFSFNQHTITPEEHAGWYLKKINQANCLYLLASWQGQLIGSLRFDITGTDALISYLVAPNFHGKGWGRILLAKGLNHLAASHPGLTTATGYVLPANTASVKVFERLGFGCINEEQQLRFTKNIQRS